MSQLLRNNLKYESGYPAFSAPRELIDSMQAVGIDIVSNATNHTLDGGSEGVHISLDNIKETGIMNFGSFKSEEDRTTSRIIKENGVSLGFLNYTYGTNGIPVPEGEGYLVNLLDLPLIVEEIEALTKKVDAVVVSVHMGPEYGTVPTEEQEQVFQTLADAGAKLILGGHSDVLQPVEWYNNEETFAIYSQASFLSGQLDVDNKQGGITEVTFVKDDKGEVQVIAPKFMPTYVLGNYDNGQMFHVVPYADISKHQIPQAMDWFQIIEERMYARTDNFEFLTHLETDSSEEAVDIFR